MKQWILIVVAALTLTLPMQAEGKRALWASINGLNEAAPHKPLYVYNNIILVSWRMLPTDTDDTAFDLYRTAAGGAEEKLNSTPISDVTCWQDKTADRTVNNTYRLTYTGSNETLDTHTVTAQQASQGLPYVSIPLTSTEALSQYPFEANDASVGDLDGDGQMDIVIKRLIRVVEGDRSNSTVPLTERHTTLFEAYKLDGTMLWRVLCGPNIILGNSASFAVADFDSDGKAEVAFRTSEGTIFGDGAEIGDMDGDGVTDYRVAGENYIGAGPEYISVIDGVTGKELARGDFIARESSEAWGDNYNKRASSYRIGVGNFDGLLPSILTGRGVYARSVLEVWDYRNGQLTKRWRFDTNDAGNESYASQGNHSLNVADLDGDGFDEVMYGSMAVDHDGTKLWNTGLGHGDANHVGKFLPNRDGLQMWHCLETGATEAALHDARTGELLWASVATSNNDTGRCMVADIDPRYEGCEMWWFGSNAHTATGVDLGYKPSSCNMAIWWSGDKNRQLLNGGKVDLQRQGESIYRVLHAQKYNIGKVNGSKENPAWYGDMLGDWREELIYPDSTFVKELKVFSTWYPASLRQPWLMSDQTYHLSTLNQNIGYNQPTHLGYWFGTAGEVIYDNEVNDDIVRRSTLWTFEHYNDGDVISSGKLINENALWLYGHSSNSMVAVTDEQTFTLGDKELSTTICMNSRTGRTLSGDALTVAASEMTANACCGITTNKAGKFYVAYSTAANRTMQVYFNGTSVCSKSGTGTLQTIELENAAPGTYLFLSSGNYKIYAVRFVTANDLTGIDEIAIEDSYRPTADGQLYNLSGQLVSADYQGIVIKNGKKYYQR